MQEIYIFYLFLMAQCAHIMAPPWVHGPYTRAHCQEAQKDEFIIKYSDINPN